MAKKIIFGMVFFVLTVISAFSEVSYGTARIEYMGNMSESAFRSYNTGRFSGEVYYNAFGTPHRLVPVDKVSRPIISAIWEALGDYDYEVGDVFLFSCYDTSMDASISVLVRLSAANGQWTFSYRAKRVV